MSDQSLNIQSIKELMHQKALLEMEYEYEKEEFCKQTEAVGITHKVKRGCEQGA